MSKLFVLQNLSSSGSFHVADGVVFANGKACLSWSEDASSVVVYDNIQSLEKDHCRGTITVKYLNTNSENNSDCDNNDDSSDLIDPYQSDSDDSGDDIDFEEKKANLVHLLSKLADCDGIQVHRVNPVKYCIFCKTNHQT